MRNPKGLNISGWFRCYLIKANLPSMSYMDCSSVLVLFPYTSTTSQDHTTNSLYELLKDDSTTSIGEKLKGCVLTFGFGY
jgi:hypothetical protein